MTGSSNVFNAGAKGERYTACNYQIHLLPYQHPKTYLKEDVHENILAALILLLSSCVSTTSVTFTTDEPGAEVFIDGSSIGETPVQAKLSNAIWENPDIVIREDGYHDNYYELEKELKGGNFVIGIILWWPSLLYSWGPDDIQRIHMIKE